MSDAAPHASRPLLRLPSSVKEFVFYLLVTWMIVFLFTIILSLGGGFALIAAIVLLVASTTLTLYQLWQLLSARQRVLQQKTVSLFWNLVNLVAWEPTEGVLFLRDKAVSFSDDNLEDGRGGVRFIYPVLGEELALRVPLEVQTLRFEDTNVLTREYLSLVVRGTIKWRIQDISKFYLLVSRELRHTSDVSAGDRSLLSTGSGTTAQTTTSQLTRSAIEWLRIIAEEQARTVISRVQSGLLLADRLAAELPELSNRQDLLAHNEFGSATSGLASRIFSAVTAQVSGYGIAIEDVALQEVGLPPEIVEQCIIAAKKAYLPTIAKRDAAVRREELLAEADVLGADALATERVLGSAPAFTLSDFLNTFVSKKLANAGGTDALAGMLTAKAAADALPGN